MQHVRHEILPKEPEMNESIFLGSDIECCYVLPIETRNIYTYIHTSAIVFAAQMIVLALALSCLNYKVGETRERMIVCVYEREKVNKFPCRIDSHSIHY